MQNTNAPQGRADQMEGSNHAPMLHALDNGFMYWADFSTGRVTRRHPGVVLISRPDTPMHIKTKDCSVSGSVLAVAPRVLRQLTIDNGPYIALHVEPAHPQYRMFENISGLCGLRVFDHDQFRDFDYALELCQNPASSAHTVHDIFDGIVARLASILGPASDRDPRMEHAIEITRNQHPEDYCFDHILDSVGLSAGRFSHLFTEQIGLPLRSFMIWQKTKDALRRLGSDTSLTEIAYDSGFSDSAHFCRTFQNSLGVPPSKFRGDSCVQVKNHLAA